MSNLNSFFYEASAVLPDVIRDAVRQAAIRFGGEVYEIRLYTNGGTVLTTDSGTKYVTSCGTFSDMPCESLRPTAEETEYAVMKAAGWSPFAHADEIKNGYLTFGSGIRMGLGGETGESGTLTVRGVSSVNIRIPHAPRDTVSGFRDGFFAGIENGLLVAGEPGSGKTTLLKKTVRHLAENGCRVCVIDERREFFGHGKPTGTVPNIDIISGGTKAAGIMRAVRLLSPEYIVCDEIGTDGESEGVRACLNSGVKFIASMHAGSLEQLVRREQFKTLFNEGIFDRIIFLDGLCPGRTAHEYTFTEVKYAICGADFDMRAHGTRGSVLRGGDEETCKNLHASVGVFK